MLFVITAMEKALRILAVDNEPSVPHILSYLFPGPRYEVTGVARGEEALASITADPDAFDLVIVDQKMPDLVGTELVKALRERGLETKVIVLSAHLSYEVRQAFENLNVKAIFNKPFDIDDMRSAVGAVAAA
jgi:two-component system response regulator (stage 0 sporulation protein F)